MTEMRIGGGQPPTLDQIADRFGGSDQHVRGSGERLYFSSSKLSLARIKAALGFPDQLNARIAKRQEGTEQIKQAIDRQYGAGMAERVLGRMDKAGQIKLSEGLRGSDLHRIQHALQTDKVRALGLQPAQVTMQNAVSGDFPALTAAFRTHLEGEYSTENLDFTQALRALGDNPADNPDGVRDLVDRFVRSNAESQVNISYPQQQKVLQALESGVPEQINSALDAAGKEITALMERDSFARFTKGLG